MPKESATSDVIDVAIVGGGVSGIYSAWRLASAQGDDLVAIRRKIGGEGPLKIALYEHTARLGGRLLSATPPSLPGVAMELGGMRYLSNQPLVKALVEKVLLLECMDQIVDQSENIAYFRRKRFHSADLCDPNVALPYNLREDEISAIKRAAAGSPAYLIFWAVFREFPEINGMKSQELQDFLRRAKVDGKPLWQWGFWNLLARHLSSEGRQLAITSIGYDVLGANANAVDIIGENFDFTPGTKYYLFKDGYETVVWRLADAFRKLGGTIAMEQTLEGFDQSADGTLELSFFDQPSVTARAVVLAMPQAALKRLRATGPLFDRSNTRMQLLLNSVSSIALYKLFLVYPSPWWTEAGVKVGRSLTDLPIRQCYYWHTDPNGGPSAVMVYNDLDSTSFWGGYQGGQLGPGDATQEGGLMHVPLFPSRGPAAPPSDNPIEENRRTNWARQAAPQGMVAEMHRQLLEMHGIPDAPWPIDAAFIDWMDAPFGGAVHFWNPGYKSWEVTEQMTQPVEGVNAFIVGEAYSTAQTWVEGALETSESMLQKRLGMAAPSWLAAGGA